MGQIEVIEIDENPEMKTHHPRVAKRQDMKKHIAVGMVAILLISTLTAGCLGGIGGGDFGDISRPGWIPDWAGTGLLGKADWFTVEINVRVHVVIEETYRFEDSDIWGGGQENRTAHALIEYEILNSTGTNDDNRDGMPDLIKVTQGFAESFAKISVPMEQFGSNFMAGSNLGGPLSELRSDDVSRESDPLTWSDMATSDTYYSGDLLYAPDNRGVLLDSGVEMVKAKVVGQATNMFNMVGAVLWFPNIATNVIVQFNDLNGDVVKEYNPVVSFPIALPFHPTLTEDKKIEESHDFKIVILAPFKLLGQKFINIAIQGMKMESNWTQLTERTPTTTYKVGWTMVITGFVIATIGLVTANSVIFVVGAVIFTAGAIAMWVGGTPDESVGKAFMHGESATTKGHKVWVYGSDSTVEEG